MGNLWITIIFTAAVVGAFVVALWVLLMVKVRRVERESGRGVHHRTFRESPAVRSRRPAEGCDICGANVTPSRWLRTENMVFRRPQFLLFADFR